MNCHIVQIQVNPIDKESLNELLAGEPEDFTRMFGQAPIMVNKDVPSGSAVVTMLYTKERPQPSGNIYEFRQTR